MNKNSSIKYARALFQLAIETDSSEKIINAFKILKPLYTKEISEYFSNPFIDINMKKDLLKKQFADLPTVLLNLLLLLTGEGKIRLLPAIEIKFNELVLISNNSLSATVTSADKLEKSDIDKIRHSLEKMTGKKILIAEETDKSLIGGVLIKAGNLIIDGSVKGKLNSLTQELTGN